MVKYINKLPIILIPIYALLISSIPVVTPIYIVTMTIIFFIFVGQWQEKLNIIKEYKSLQIFIALIVISIVCLSYGQGDIKPVTSFAKDFIIVLTTIFFLRKKPSLKEKSLNMFIIAMIITAIISILNVIFLSHKTFIHFPHSSFPMLVTQNEVAASLAISSILLIRKAKLAECIKYKVTFIILSIILILVEYLLNQSRTGYLMESLVIGYYFYLFCCKYNNEINKAKFSVKRFIAVIIFSLISVYAIYNTSDIFKTRVNHAINSVVSYATNPDKASKSTSVGLRLSWYYTSIHYSTSSPRNLLLGCGTGNFHRCLNDYIKTQDKYEQQRMKAPYQNPHNQYIFFLIQSGIFALILFLAWIFSIIKIDSAKLTSIDRISTILIILMLCIGCMFNSYLLDLRMGPIFLFILSMFLSGNKINNK